VTWVVPETLFAAPWATLKDAGLAQIKSGQSDFDLSAWTEASSAHLAVLLVWWSSAQRLGHGLQLHGLNPHFQTLARLGGVAFLMKESHSHGGR